MKRFCLIFIVVLFSSAVAVANDNLQNLLEKINSTEQTEERLDLYWEIYFETLAKDLDLSFKYALEYNKLAISSDRLDHKSNSFWALAWLNKKLGNLDKSYENYLLAIHWGRLAGLKERIGDGFKNIGNIFKEVSEFDKAYQYYYDALAIYEDLNLNPKIINTYRSISMGKWKEQNFDDAFKYAERALALSIRDQNDKYINILYNLVGMINHEAGDYRKAREMYFESINNIDSLVNKSEILGIAYNNIGETFSKQGDFEKAHAYFDKALKEKRFLNKPKTTAYTLQNLGKLYLMKNDYSRATTFLGESISLMDVNKIDEDLTGAIEEITKAYDSANNQGLNLDLSPLLAYNKILSKQFRLTQQMRKQLIEQHNQYMLDRSFEKQDLQANIGQLQNTKLYLIWAGVLIIAVFLFLIFLMNRALKRAQRKSQEIVETLNQMKGVLGKSFQRMLEDDTFTITTKK